MNKAELPNERDRLKAETAARIVEAAFSLMRDDPTTPFSHEAVAARAGVAARTAYRHFPTQDDLVASVWRHLRDTTATRWPKALAEIVPMVEELYVQFERNSTLTRAIVSVSPHVNISRHGSMEGRAAFRTALSEHCAGWSEDATAQLVATCVSIYSAPFWIMLRDRGQLTQAAAIAAAQSAMQALLAHGDAAGSANIVTTAP